MQSQPHCCPLSSLEPCRIPSGGPILSSTPWFCFWRQGDVSETIRIFFEQSKVCPPAAKSLLTIQEVDEFLIQLSKLTKEDDQQSVLQQISRR